jgi:type IV pilus assembly protein PilM
MFPWLSSNTMGIDLTDTELNLVYFQSRGEEIKRVRSASFSLPQGLIDNGIIVQPYDLLTHLKAQLHKWKWNSKRINFLAPSQHVINRYIRIPDVAEDDIRRIVQQEVEHYLHFPFEDPVWDCYDMGLSGAEPGKKDVLISAMSSGILFSYVNFFQKLGMKITAVDIRGVALLRVLHQLVPMQQLPDTYAVLQLGRASADITIYHNNQLRFNRNISYQAETDLGSIEAAASIDQGTNLPPQFSLVARDMINEISRSINFFKFSILNQDVPLDKVYVTGELMLLIYALKNSDNSLPWVFEDLMEFLRYGREVQISPKTVTAFGLALKKTGYRL